MPLNAPPPRNPPGKPAPRVAGMGAGSLAELELLQGEALQQKLLSVFRSPTYKPPVLPNVAFELSDLTRRKNVSFDDVTRLVEKDPMIVARVLKLAQTPLYGGGRTQVASLRAAITRLGVGALRDLVWQVAMDMRLFKAPGYTTVLQRLQSHSTFMAHCARIVAQHADLQSEQAFLCGLLHDIGWSGTLIAISEGNTPRPPSPQLLAAIDAMHAEAGAAMAKLWGLSSEMIEVIRHHHTLARDKPPVSLLVPVLVVAEHLAEQFGFAMESALTGDAAPAPAAPEAAASERLDGHASGRFEQAFTMLQLGPKMDKVRDLVELAARGMDGGDFG